MTVCRGHVLDRVDIDLGEFQGGFDLDPSVVGMGDDHIGLRLVQTDGGVVQLSEQDVHPGVEDVADQEDDIGGPRGCDDLPPASLSAGRVLDQTGHVQDLDLGVVVLHDPWDDVEGGEVVGADLGLGTGELVQEGGFTDGRESDQGDGGVPGLLDVESLGGALGRTALLLLHSEPGDLRLQLPDVSYLVLEISFSSSLI